MSDKEGKGQTALVTGASSGIGLDLARCFAAGGFNLVLVARRREELEKIAAELKAAHGIEARVLAKDLSAPNACEEVFQEVGSTAIDVLVNNAGFASWGAFNDLETARELQEIQLNVVALTHLTKL